jgi:iron complex transport system substrate-binding protein
MKHIITILLSIFLLAACTSGHAVADNADGDTIAATPRLSLIDCGSYIQAIVTDADSAIIGRYALVSRDSAEVATPQGFTRIDTPLERAVVYSSVHAAAINELGKIGSIVGTADADYLSDDDPMRAMISSGKVADIGSSMSPSIEKVIDCRPQAVLLSPVEGGSLGGVDRIGIPLIFLADYLECEPLQRAKWIKFLGVLFGAQDKSIEIYQDVAAKYTALRQNALAADSRPTVITEKPYSGTWYVPGGASYMACMLADAGASYPWADNTSAGSLPLDVSAVIERGSEAEFWLVKDGVDYNAESFEAAMPHAHAFRAFPDGVYVANTLSTSLFRDIAFHPEMILADFIHIFHPDINPDYQLKYYKPIK